MIFKQIQGPGKLLSRILAVSLSILSNLGAPGCYQRISILGAYVNLDLVNSSNENLVSTESSGKFCLETFILQSRCVNTGFLLYFSKLWYSCVFHKTTLEALLFLITVGESRQLEVVRASNTHSLVQATCDSVADRLNSNNTEYFLQSLFCTCQLSKAER